MAGYQGDDDGIISAINVTPLVDITLVLLLVFMVTARIIAEKEQQLPLDLPKTASGEVIQGVFGLEVYANGDLVIDGEKVKEDEALVEIAKKRLAKDKDLRAVIRADKAVPHGRIMRVLDLLKQARISKIAFGVAPLTPEDEKEERERKKRKEREGGDGK